MKTCFLSWFSSWSWGLCCSLLPSLPFKGAGVCVSFSGWLVMTYQFGNQYSKRFEICKMELPSATQLCQDRTGWFRNIIIIGCCHIVSMELVLKHGQLQYTHRDWERNPKLAGTARQFGSAQEPSLCAPWKCACCTAGVGLRTQYSLYWGPTAWGHRLGCSLALTSQLHPRPSMRHGLPSPLRFSHPPSLCPEPPLPCTSWFGCRMNGAAWPLSHGGAWPLALVRALLSTLVPLGQRNTDSHIIKM